MGWEFTFLRSIIENIQGPFLDFIFKAVTLLGEGGAIFFLMAFIFVFFKKTRRTGLVILAGLIIVAGANQFILKPLVARPRPFLDPGVNADALWLSNHVEAWGELNAFNKWLLPHSHSFMSGHTLSAFIFGFGILIYHPKWSPPALLFALLMGFSRLYFGFHFLTDVLAAILTAALTMLIIYFINRRFEKTFVSWWNAFIGLFKKKKMADVLEAEETPQVEE